MLDSIITFTQSWTGQFIGLIGFFIFPLLSAIYVTHLEDCDKKSKALNIILTVFFIAGSIFAINEESLLKTIFRAVIYIFLMTVITGFYIDMMKSR